MTADRRTVDVYDAGAADYAATIGREHRSDASLLAFLSKLPKGGRILDFGCGPGRWAVPMIAAGFEVEGCDASAGMVAEAARIEGLTVWQATFDALEADGDYDGIWANFSLLHAERDKMPVHLARLFKALKPGGVLHLGLKEGTGAARDGLGRFYTYYTVEEITGLLSALGMLTSDLMMGEGKGFDGTVAKHFTLLAQKPSL